MKRHLFYSLVLYVLVASPVSGAVPRPFLYPNPEDPGKNPFTEVREDMLKQFDKDGDQFLNRAEREAMRRATWQKAEARSNWVRETKREEDERNRPPERWLKLYDKNKNKRFDDGEWEVARRNEMQRVTALFDKDQDGKISDGEKATIIATMKEGNLHGYDAYIHREVGGIEDERRRGRSGRRSRGNPEERWKPFDTNQDGKASLAELEAIRNHEANR